MHFCLTRTCNTHVCELRWKVTVLAGGDRAKDEAGRIPASAALSTAAGGKGDDLHQSS